MNDMTLVVMANEPDLVKKLLNTLHWGAHDGLISLAKVRNLVSSPKLAEFHIRGLHGDGLVPVGDTFLDARTLLADRPYKTFAVPIQAWPEFSKGKIFLENVGLHDKQITRIELWPFNPAELDEVQLTLAIGLSYTLMEFYREPRVAGAVDDLIRPLGFFVPDEEF
ncbi:hypothetical protein ACIOUF_15860 [Pseudomonas iridis]|uniref:Phage tail protein n=1 Tax=Pseudomonas iridis TaxID=2710587 RepID=A0ABW8DKR7_9PSED